MVWTNKRERRKVGFTREIAGMKERGERKVKEREEDEGRGSGGTREREREKKKRVDEREREGRNEKGKTEIGFTGERGFTKENERRHKRERERGVRERVK